VFISHACGFKLANDGHDTRACSTISATRISNIQHTVRYTELRYTELSPDRFRDFWR
jgi:hypothetical protein